MNRRGPYVWTYTRDSWEPKHRWLPFSASDEWGWRTLVLPIPFSGYLVVALWKCHCDSCGWGRTEILNEHWDGKHEGVDNVGSRWHCDCPDCPATDPNEASNDE